MNLRTLSFTNQVSGLKKKVSVATRMVNSVSKMVTVEVKLKAYYALIYSKLIYSILSWGKNSNENKDTMEWIIKSAWMAISHENLDISKGLLNFESMFS